MTSERASVTSTDGLSLEAEIDGPDEPAACLVLCHPHPKMGGTMNAPLLLALRDALVDRAWAVLRFNFRGIGSSEGSPSTGTAEIADAEGALAYARRRFPDAPVAVAGWSFGGGVALWVAAKEPGLAACAVLAPAVVAKAGITDGPPPPDSFSFKGPTLVVCGANDDQIPPAECRRWAEEAGARYEEIRGANHFFWAQYEPVTTLVADFLDDAV